MRIETLNFISELTASLNIPYKYMEWKQQPPETYFTGEYQEVESMTKEEDGLQETTFILTGFTRSDWLSLEKCKNEIEKALPKTAILENVGIAVFYSFAFPVPTEDAELKRLQINLKVKEWSVN